MNIFKEDNCRGVLMDYYKSGDRENDYSFSVSYASLIFSKEAGKTSINRSPGKPAPELKKKNGKTWR